MKKEVKSIIRDLQNILIGEPWFGRAVYPVLEEIDVSSVYTKPNDSGHSLIELLYHMITWADFCLKQLENASLHEIKEVEGRDWREIDLKNHTWKKGMSEFRKINKQIISILETKEDPFLKEMVPGREFNFRFMLNGLIQHNIYHLGQIAYVKKLMS